MDHINKVDDNSPVIPEEDTSGAVSKTAYVGPWLMLFLQFYFLISSVIFLPYYNWQYAKEHGFAKWLVFGEIVPTGKAYVWPYFVFFDKGNYVTFTEAERENLSHFSASLHADVAATDILYSKNKATITKSDIEQVMSLRKTALSEAKAVSDNVLDKIHPDLKKHFREEYQQCLVRAIEFFEGPDHSEIVFDKANELGLKWSRWYNSNETRAELKVPK